QIRLILNETYIEDKKGFYNRLFHEKRDFFVSLADSLAVHKEDAFAALGDGMEPILLRFRELERATETSLNVAVELKKYPVMQGLTDEELLRTARITTQRSIKAGEIIFREDDLTEGIYFIHSGSVRVVKPTPFGEQQLASLQHPDFFGE